MTRLARLILMVAIVILVAPKFLVTQTRETGTVPEIKSAGTSPANNSKSTNSASNGEKLDINSSSKDELRSIPEIGEKYAQKIIDGRPYRTKRDLLTRKIIPRSTYEKVKDQIIAHRSTAKTSEPEKHN